jgi:catechol-2,3-dioxygenase
MTARAVKAHSLHCTHKKKNMKIKNIDHFVITTADLQSCLDFYVGTLGMEHRESNGHHNLYFPGGKIVTIQFRPSYNQTKNPEVILGIFCIGMAEVA